MQLFCGARRPPCRFCARELPVGREQHSHGVRVPLVFAREVFPVCLGRFAVGRRRHNGYSACSPFHCVFSVSAARPARMGMHCRRDPVVLIRHAASMRSIRKTDMELPLWDRSDRSRRGIVFYSARILSTGLRFALLRTGRNVARKEVNAAIPSMTSHESGPKIKREILIELRPRPFFWNLRCKAMCETERYHFRLRGAAGGRPLSL